jgi:hypothetical protein
VARSGCIETGEREKRGLGEKETRAGGGGPGTEVSSPAPRVARIKVKVGKVKVSLAESRCIEDGGREKRGKGDLEKRRRGRETEDRC